MVSINSKINNPGTINTSPHHIRTRSDSASNLKKQTNTDFSKLLEKKQSGASIKTATTANTAVTPKKPEASLETMSTYSPLMLRYGANRINEIKDIAKDFGIDDLTNEDFDYAIRYGRSLLADYIV